MNTVLMMSMAERPQLKPIRWGQVCWKCPDCGERLMPIGYTFKQSDLPPEGNSDVHFESDPMLVFCPSCESEFELDAIPSGQRGKYHCPDCSGELEMGGGKLGELLQCVDCGMDWVLHQRRWLERPE